MASITRTPLRALVLTLAIALLQGARTVTAHEHHDLPEGMVIELKPLDSILWTHIIIQTFTWGIVFPTGMVLGMVKSKWHVPVQTIGALLALIGQTLGHKHKTGPFGHNVHSTFGPILGWLLVGQVLLGAFLKLHLERYSAAFGKTRPIFVFLHGLTGKTLPIMAWVQMLFGGIVALRFCRADHMGQCLAHFIMGSAFIAYGICLTILLLVGQLWLKRTGRSQEFFDSLIIAAWGCVNTFTEHHWGDPWVRNDLQHTTMGIVWWCAGLVGMWLSRTRDGRPKRNLMPAIVILLTGYGMSAHPQDLPLSTMMHSAFGWTLMAAGAARIVEISFVLRDKPALRPDGSNPNSFQYLPPFLLYASGFLFMGSTEEQMALLSSADVTHVAYILILYSVSFLLFLLVNILVHIYAVHAWPDHSMAGSIGALGGRGKEDGLPLTQPGAGVERGRGFYDERGSGSIDADADAGLANGYGKTNGNGHAYAPSHALGNGTAAMSTSERNRLREAQEFELDALISEDEEEEKGRSGRHRL